MINHQITSPNKWYVVYTYPQLEKNIERALSRANITCFLPVQKVTKQWSDRKKTVEVALFPNYIFVKTTPQERFDILNFYGVSHYVCCSKQPVVVSDSDIDIIRKLNVEPDLTVERSIQMGETVDIIDGPFEGFKGVVFERKGRKRFGIKIDTLNQFVSFEVDQSSIRPVELVN
ncbi:transcription elongation factor/antiterminator RfaH [Pedobacter cryoconitis]|uniref:Transcription elongation factor/antiterminator RfaH n=1 Tax=Pedobacter cryoconitis TaxID=188932 RepID=A0A7W8YVC8_9SPHI|nr:UpxY family transcription antiterminator [Pedobacter cryoconitis]MBB5622481.1 transcription elongation factor/antiterminator RfaH [Pedobacter cryoconitis]MBB5647635.1 transcription elongation factor/antiterminator RfaH [Pedobacter cryoconitis]